MVQLFTHLNFNLYTNNRASGKILSVSWEYKSVVLSLIMCMWAFTHRLVSLEKTRYI